MALGTGILQAATVVTYIVLARLLEPAAYGTYRQLFLINQVAWGVLFSALPTTLLYFSGRAIEPGEADRVVRHHLYLAMTAAVLVPAGLLLFASSLSKAFNNPDIEILMPAFALYPFAYVLIHLVPPVLIAKNRTDLMPMFTGGTALLTATAVVITAAVTRNLMVVIWTATAATGLTALAGAILILALSRNPSRHGVATREIVVYGWPLLVATGISLIGLRLDHFTVSHLLGPAMYAIYAVGAFELPVYTLVKTSSTSVLLPELSAHAQRGDWQAVEAAWHDLHRKNAAILLPASAALFAFSTDCIVTLFGSAYREAAVVFAIFTLLGPVRSVSFNLILRAMGRTQPDLVGAALFLLVVAVAVVPTTKAFGFVGAAGLIVVTTFGVAALLLFLTRSATDGRLTLRRLYPPRLLGLFIILLLSFSTLRWIVSGANLGPLVNLAIGAATGMAATLVLLRNQHLLIPLDIPGRIGPTTKVEGTDQHVGR